MSMKMYVWKLKTMNSYSSKRICDEYNVVAATLASAISKTEASDKYQHHEVIVFAELLGEVDGV
jgi:hypothetical protein